MAVFQAHHCPIYIGKKSHSLLEDFLLTQNYSKLFVLVDTNTHQQCWSYFVSHFKTQFPFEVIEVEAGEAFKNIEICTQLWHAISELQGDRKSVLINLGGGVITDLGGFVASTYQRGIDFINIPTTLLAMVDASIGGKTGVNLDVLKNQIGVIAHPQLIVVDQHYLSTLPVEELRSGMAEMFKHGLIYDPLYWTQMVRLNEFHLDDLETLIKRSIEIKNAIVAQDPTEKGLRKTLNFGHTLGHAIESESMSERACRKLFHGEAVAIGCILAAYLSHKILDFPYEDTVKIKEILLHYFPKQSFSKEKISNILDFLKFDKKNSHGNINFVLLKKIGEPIRDCQVCDDFIFEAFDFYAKN